MRKKQHKKINPKNKEYDRFYVINYLVRFISLKNTIILNIIKGYFVEMTANILLDFIHPLSSSARIPAGTMGGRVKTNYLSIIVLEVRATYCFLRLSFEQFRMSLKINL